MKGENSVISFRPFVKQVFKSLENALTDSELVVNFLQLFKTGLSEHNFSLLTFGGQNKWRSK